MSAMTISAIVFVTVFAGALLGMFIRTIVPANHLNSESKDVIKLGMGLIGTMAALVLSLLISSAKASFDTRAAEVTQLTANVMLLDRVMAHYGAETKEVRDQLRRSVVLTIGQLWPDAGTRVELTPDGGLDALHDTIQVLSPRSEVQRALQTHASSIATSLAQTRWLLVAQGGRAVPMPFLVVLVLWLSVILMSFGLFTQRNTTVIAALFICALAFSSAIFLVLELDQPFDGVIQISSTPMRQIVGHLSR
jgi:hypothetical protein